MRLTLAGELDLASEPQLRAALTRVDADATLVIVDLRRVDFIDVRCTRVLLEEARAIRDAGRRLVVIRGPLALDRMLELSGIDHRLELVDLSSAVTG